MNKNLKNKNGITLIALIVTIIIMLILAGVTIRLVKDEGLFDYARKAKSETENAISYEQGLINEMYNFIDANANETTGGNIVEEPINNYRLIFDAKPGNFPNGTSNVDKNGNYIMTGLSIDSSDKDEFIIPDITPILQGYEFVGWADVSGAPVAGYLAEDRITLTYDGPIKTIYAVYRKQ